MLLKNKKCYAETNQDVVSPCNNRYLTSVSAVPNPSGDCSIISISFKYAGDIETQFFSWNTENSGELFEVSGCIDLTTLTYNCVGRITFNWDDGINCCV